jgi:hypothetical protein
MGFDVGYDALEEDRQTHFSTPPAIDEPAPPVNVPTGLPATNVSAPNGSFASPSIAAPVAAPSGPGQPKPNSSQTPVPQTNQSWWQRLLEWVGLG